MAVQTDAHFSLRPKIIFTYRQHLKSIDIKTLWALKPAIAVSLAKTATIFQLGVASLRSPATVLRLIVSRAPRATDGRNAYWNTSTANAMDLCIYKFN